MSERRAERLGRMIARQARVSRLHRLHLTSGIVCFAPLVMMVGASLTKALV